MATWPRDRLYDFVDLSRADALFGKRGKTSTDSD